MGACPLWTGSVLRYCNQYRNIIGFSTTLSRKHIKIAKASAYNITGEISSLCDSSISVFSGTTMAAAFFTAAITSFQVKSSTK